jgi:hypothetical protein
VKNQPTLPTFEKNAVANATVKITKAGDGLSAALKVKPEALFLGADQYYVLAGRVTQVTHKDVDGVVTRVHTVETQGITSIDPELARKAIEEAALETERLRAEQTGQQALPEETVDADIVDEGDPVESTVEASTPDNTVPFKRASKGK